MFSSKSLICVAACVVLGFAAFCSTARADVLGPGDISDTGLINDGYLVGDSIDFNGTSPPLGAGTYRASDFSCRIACANGDSGVIVPFLANGLNGFIPIAVGSPIAYSAPQPWTDYGFGGSDTFTLSDPTTVYAGYYWKTTSGAIAPIAFLNGVGDTQYIEGAFDSSAVGSPAAYAPVVNTTLGINNFGYYIRDYQFSITVSSVPEPNTFVLLATGLIGLLAYAWRKRR